MRVWERLWEIPRLEVHERIASTNDRLRELAREGVPRFTTVIAEEQTAGRGRSGDPWWSPRGAGLWMSVLLEGGAPARPPLSPLLVGVAAARAVTEIAPALEPRLRWPNDLYVDGRKVGGVLCEGSPGGGVVAGIGLNVSQDAGEFPAELRGRAGSLEAAAGGWVSRSELAGATLQALGNLFRSGPPEVLEGSLLAEVEALDALRGARVETEAGAAGRVRGIGHDGALLVEERGGRILRVVAGSVRRLDEE